jgi:hypothetical protein
LGNPFFLTFSSSFPKSEKCRQTDVRPEIQDFSLAQGHSFFSSALKRLRDLRQAQGGIAQKRDRHPEQKDAFMG